MEKEKEAKLEEFFDSLSLPFDVLCYVDTDSIDKDTDFESLTAEIDEYNGFEIEFIFNGDAIEYLSEHDISLRNSLEIAKELEYDIDSIDSSLLASLLASQNAKAEWYENEEIIEEFLSGLFDEDK